MGTTEIYGLKTIEAGDSIADDGHKFSADDRRTIDELLFMGATAHRHDGSENALAAAPAAPTVTPATDGGFLKPSTTYLYKTSIVDTNGRESIASEYAVAVTAAPLNAPGAPTLVPSQSGGGLKPGSHFYVLSAWVDSETSESAATNKTGLTLPRTAGSDQQIEVVFPTFPSIPSSGSYGFNVFKKGPGGNLYQFLASVDISDGETDSWVDDGSVEADCNRIAPRKSVSSSTNCVTIELSGDLDPGETWRIYRSETASDWSASLIQHVVAETSEGSGVTTSTFVDRGETPGAGAPPDGSFTIPSPDPILLTNGAEVQGILPPGFMCVPHVVDYTMPGATFVHEGTFSWKSPFWKAHVANVVCTFNTAPDDTVTVELVNKTKDHVICEANIYPGYRTSERVSTSDDELAFVDADDELIVSVTAADSGTAQDLAVQFCILGIYDVPQIPDSLLSD